MPCCYVLFQNIPAVVALFLDFTVYHLQLNKNTFARNAGITKKELFLCRK